MSRHGLHIMDSLLSGTGICHTAVYHQRLTHSHILAKPPVVYDRSRLNHVLCKCSCHMSRNIAHQKCHIFFQFISSYSNVKSRCPKARRGGHASRNYLHPTTLFPSVYFEANASNLMFMGKQEPCEGPQPRQIQT